MPYYSWLRHNNFKWFFKIHFKHNRNQLILQLIMETKENEHYIEFSQEFSVPAETLYEAWTSPEHLKQWWHPMQDSLVNVKNELNEGGVVAYEFEKKEFEVTGNYQQVQPNEKLVYSWNWKFFNDLPDESYILTISFESKDEGSILTVKQEGLPGEEAALPHQDAWKAAFESLKSHLEGNSEESTGEESKENAGKENDSVKSDEGMNDRSGGYNELPEQAKVGGG
jgi:uncharacterized protein YndB with AHSA1/START domain